MAININFTNKSIDFYSDNEEKFNQIKSILATYQEEKDTEIKLDEEEKDTEIKLDEEEKDIEIKLDEQQLDEENLETDETESSENLEKFNDNAKIDNLKNIDNIDYEEENKSSLKLSDNFVNLEEFTGIFLNKSEEIPESLLQVLKLEKQNLILPDEIVLYDYIVMPILNFFKAKQSLNLKLSIDHKDFEKHNFDAKIMKKVKPNSFYAVQLVKEEIAKRFYNYFSNLGIKVKSVNFYSGALANFYISHVRGTKNASIVVKISQNKTTILAISHGFVVCSETINAGERDIIRNSTYKFDEYSRRSISHKFVCYSVSQISESTNEKELTRDQIEKAYSKTKTNPLAGNFQYKSINIIDLIKKKIDDMQMFLNDSELNIKIDAVFVDVKNDETFAKLKLDDAIKIYYSENDIFKSQKQSKLFNFNKISSKLTNKGFFKGSLWSKRKKKA